MSRFAVLGAGVAGLCVATELAARGAQVTLHDPAGGPGGHGCSWWAGGMLAPWCEYENAEEPVLVHGQAALGWWAEKTAVTTRGTLVVAHARDRSDLDRFARRTHGHAPVSGAQIAALEPDLGTRFPAGLYFAEEAHLDPRRALRDLTDSLAARGMPVRDDAPPPGAQIVDCTGLAAREALPELRGVKGEMLVIRAPELTLSRPVRLLHPRIPLYIVPRGDGVYMLGATMVEAEDRGRISARAMLELLSAAYALNPAFAEAEILEIGTDLRPAFPDNLPRVTRQGDVTYVNGLYRHGYLLAPAMAQQAAEALLGPHLVETADAACH
ncbi:FAD-dependent oxidoreductase [Dinoroseobacter sp. S375]|uniref:FAD-dependent oxidoreductase n=1 Tax=Dinoroseobacter sp. S375 TaxID=3415136 RepID=UPI003C7C5D62